MTPAEWREALRARIVASLTGFPSDVSERILRGFDQKPTDGEITELLHAVGELTARQRRVFTLRYVYGMPASAIGQQLSITANEVESDLAVAFARVRSLLQAHVTRSR